MLLQLLFYRNHSSLNLLVTVSMMNTSRVINSFLIMCNLSLSFICPFELTFLYLDLINWYQLFIRYLKNDDKKLNMPLNDQQSLPDFGGLRMMIAFHFSLICGYDGLPSLKTKVRPMYVKYA